MVLLNVKLCKEMYVCLTIAVKVCKTNLAKTLAATWHLRFTSLLFEVHIRSPVVTLTYMYGYSCSSTITKGNIVVKTLRVKHGSLVVSSASGCPLGI